MLDTINRSYKVAKDWNENDPDEILYWTITSASEIIHGEWMAIPEYFTASQEILQILFLAEGPPPRKTYDRQHRKLCNVLKYLGRK